MKILVIFLLVFLPRLSLACSVTISPPPTLINGFMVSIGKSAVASITCPAGANVTSVDWRVNGGPLSNSLNLSLLPGANYLSGFVCFTLNGNGECSAIEQEAFVGSIPSVSASAGGCSFKKTEGYYEAIVSINATNPDPEYGSTSASGSLDSYPPNSQPTFQVTGGTGTFRAIRSGNFGLIFNAATGYAGNSTGGFSLPSDPFSLTVSCADIVPTISLGSDTTVSGNSQFCAPLTIVDNDNDPITSVAWQFGKPNGSQSSVPATTFGGSGVCFALDVPGVYSLTGQATSNGKQSNFATINVKNNARPEISTITYSPSSPSIGAEVTLTATVSDPDGDALTGTWSVGFQPSGSNISLTGTTLTSAKFTPSVPGNYQIDYFAVDSLGASTSYSVFVTVSSFAPPKFKVLLGNEEYLFDDCAPDAHPCKAYASTHTGGEFLKGDEVTLDASDTVAPGLGDSAYSWTIKKLPDGLVKNKIGKVAALVLDEDGEYEIKLKLNNDSNLQVTKKLIAQTEILAGYPNPYYQTSYPFTKYGYEKKETISATGCLLTSTVNMFHQHFDFLPSGRLINPPSMDEIYVQRKDYFSENALSLWSAANTHNVISPLVKFEYTGRETKTRAQLEKLARKRINAIMEIHSVSVGKSLSPEKIDRCVKERDPVTKKPTKVLSFKECHASLTHFILLNGIARQGNRNEIRIIDPANENRTTLSASPIGDEYRNLRVFTASRSIPAPTRKSTIQILVSNPDLVFTAYSGSEQILKFSGFKEKILVSNDFSSSYVESLLVSDPNSEEAGKKISGGNIIVLPEVDAGQPFFLNLKSFYDDSTKIDIQVKDATGNVNYSKRVDLSFLADQTKTIEVIPSEMSSLPGTVIVDKAVFLEKNQSGIRSAKISGVLVPDALSDGYNLSQQGLSLNLSDFSARIEGAAFFPVSGGLVYRNLSEKRGVRELIVRENGEFSLEVIGIDLKGLTNGGRVQIDFQAGNDFLTGFIVPGNLKASPLLRVDLDKPVYVTGERASFLATSTLFPRNPEIELGVNIQYNGTNIPTTSQSAGKWLGVSPRLEAGERLFRFQLYEQNKRQTNSIARSISERQAKIQKVENSLARETDPDIVAELRMQKAQLLEQIRVLNEKIFQNRRMVGDYVELSVKVQN